MVIIDGQHRWFALQQVYQKQPDNRKELAIAKTKRFKATYRMDFSLNSADREALQKAQKEQQRHEVDVKVGKPVTSEFSNPFDQLVTQYVAASVELATDAFKKYLYEES